MKNIAHRSQLPFDRPTRPLLIIEDSKLLITEKNLWGQDFEVLLREGVVEYVDSFEQEHLEVAINIDSMDVRKKQIEVNKIKRDPAMGDVRPYTHCELDPTAILGYSASAIPLANHNQGPRNTYQCSMGKQAIGIRNSNHLNRLDTSSKILSMPTRPIFEPLINDMIGLNSLPNGQMITIAIMDIYGFNQEDAFVMNKASIDRGLFRYTNYHTITIKSNITINIIVKPKLTNPDLIYKYRHIVSKEEALDSDEYQGIAKIGSLIEEGDCIVSQFVKNKDGVYKSISYYANIDDVGVVDRVFIGMDNRTSSESVIKIRIKQLRKPIVGSKMAPRYAQKGTISKISPEEDMPFIGGSNGERIDLVINPKSFPSRMTMAMLLEIIASKAFILKGERINATTHRKINLNDIQRELTELGYDSFSRSQLYNGITGEPITALITTGPCFYQILKHDPRDKIKTRGLTGAQDILTRQAVRGRTQPKGGGLRIGEMERDAFNAHGAEATLRSLTCEQSDATDVAVCQTCGTQPLYDPIEYNFTCGKCKVPTNFGRLRIPHTTQVFRNQMSIAGFDIRGIPFQE